MEYMINNTKIVGLGDLSSKKKLLILSIWTIFFEDIASLECHCKKLDIGATLM